MPPGYLEVILKENLMHMDPTVGRQVWYHADPAMMLFRLSELPLAATVVHVNPDATVNLVVLDHLGNPYRVANCALVQDVEANKPAAPYCTWMPHQKAQAELTVKVTGPTVVTPSLIETKPKKGGAA